MGNSSSSYPVGQENIGEPAGLRWRYGREELTEWVQNDYNIEFADRETLKIFNDWAKNVRKAKKADVKKALGYTIYKPPSRTREEGVEMHRDALIRDVIYGAAPEDRLADVAVIPRGYLLWSIRNKGAEAWLSADGVRAMEETYGGDASPEQVSPERTPSPEDRRKSPTPVDNVQLIRDVCSGEKEADDLYELPGDLRKFFVQQAFYALNSGMPKVLLYRKILNAIGKQYITWDPPSKKRQEGSKPGDVVVSEYDGMFYRRKGSEWIQTFEIQKPGMADSEEEDDLHILFWTFLMDPFAKQPTEEEAIDIGFYWEEKFGVMHLTKKEAENLNLGNFASNTGMRLANNDVIELLLDSENWQNAQTAMRYLAITRE